MATPSHHHLNCTKWLEITTTVIHLELPQIQIVHRVVSVERLLRSRD